MGIAEAPCSGDDGILAVGGDLISAGIFHRKDDQNHICMLYCCTLKDTLQLHLVGPNGASIALVARLCLIEPTGGD